MDTINYEELFNDTPSPKSIDLGIKELEDQLKRLKNQKKKWFTNHNPDQEYSNINLINSIYMHVIDNKISKGEF